MSFAVTATSKALAAAGIDHIVTEGGRILVEAAYDGDKMVPALISVTKQGKTYIAKRSEKKLVKFRDYCRALMKARREAGYSKTERFFARSLARRPDTFVPSSRSLPRRLRSRLRSWLRFTRSILRTKASKKAIKSVIKKSKAAGKKVVKKTASEGRP